MITATHYCTMHSNPLINIDEFKRKDRTCQTETAPDIIDAVNMKLS
jgi:hypothetical protein